jgi:hypothetical protein
VNFHKRIRIKRLDLDSFSRLKRLDSQLHYSYTPFKCLASTRFEQEQGIPNPLG